MGKGKFEWKLEKLKKLEKEEDELPNEIKAVFKSESGRGLNDHKTPKTPNLDGIERKIK